jgi:hypothetical protein
MSAATHLLFVSKPTGYELTEREGEPPTRGSSVELEANGRRYTVAKVASSPLPGDERRCAYLVPS